MPGDGFLPTWFKREPCPNCKKKGVYYAGSPDVSIGDHRCMYCKTFFFKSDLFKDLKKGEKPTHEKPVAGFDEWEKKEVTVCYRLDTGRFFDHPYTGAVWPINRMHRWRESQ